jgi:hypothetical protein
MTGMIAPLLKHACDSCNRTVNQLEHVSRCDLCGYALCDACAHPAPSSAVAH